MHPEDAPRRRAAMGDRWGAWDGNYKECTHLNRACRSALAEYITCATPASVRSQAQQQRRRKRTGPRTAIDPAAESARARPSQQTRQVAICLSASSFPVRLLRLGTRFVAFPAGIMESVAATHCVFCEAESVPHDSITQMQTPHDAHRDPLLEMACTRGQRLQATDLYQSVDSLREWQIRILELQPHHCRAPLVSRLFNADMLRGGGIVESGTKNRQTYVALSYYWGDDRRPKYHLECNGIDYPIPVAAYRALHRLRDRYVPTYIWIDTVCINQHDDQDRSKQVSKMRSIYQNARKVVVYLGEHNKDEQSTGGKVTSATEWVIGLLSDFQASRMSLHGIFLTMTDRIRKGHTSGAGVCAVHASLFEQGVCELSRLKWLDRVWVKQEIWAARSIEIRYGEAILPWQSLVSIDDFLGLLTPILTLDQQRTFKSRCHDLSRKLGRLVIGAPTAHAAADMDDKPNSQLLDGDDYQQDIINVFRRSEGAESSCMHDRVYGLLGMTSVNVEQIDDVRHNCFVISYIEPPVETFTRLAKYIICRDRCLHLLFLNKAFPRPEHAGEVDGTRLPSWVPDWRYAIGSVDKHTNCPTSWSNRNWYLPLQTRYDTLSIQGHFLGTIASRIKETTTTRMEIHWIHPRVDNSRVEVAIMPLGRCRYDTIALFEGATTLALIRTTGEPSTFHYIGPVYSLPKRPHNTRETRPHFNAVIAFMEILSSENNDSTEPERIDLV